jgi:hypothetical protein
MGITDRVRRRIGIATVASGALAATAAIALAGSAGAATAGAAAAAAPSAGYQFVTLGSHHDRTFNQLLGINNNGVIAGYFGSGAKGHPNKGYTIRAPYAQGNISNENFPGSAQTQVTGLNDRGVTVGFFANAAGANFGWYNAGGHFHEVNFPTGTPAKPPVDQLLGVNNHGVAVGFFANASGINRGYTFNINTKKFGRVQAPGAGLGPSLTAAAINNRGDVAGFYNKTATLVDGFVKIGGGFITLQVPGATATQAFGVNDSDWVVGAYTVSGGATHGFIWKPGHGFTLKVDDPNGIGTTLLNGINNENDIVGFYTDSAGNTDGMVGFPGF